MKLRVLMMLIGYCLVSCEQKSPSVEPSEIDNKIVIGKIDNIHSQILDEDREIWVHLPEGANDNLFEATKYPVLYLLDGSAHFYSVTGMIKQLSTNGNTISPEMIVVGIPNTDRTRDLTPTHVKEMNGDSIFTKTSGGGDHFLDFIEKELIPYVEKTYPATSYRTFVGHSFGGLSVIHALTERPELFNNYVAIDPSLWWDNQELLSRSTQKLRSNDFAKKALFVGVANTMNDEMTIDKVEKDTTEFTKHIRSILEFVKTTESMTENGLKFDWKYYDNDDHGSVPLITEYDAIRFLFPWYTLKGINQFFDPTSTATAEDLQNLVDKHYKNASNEFGYETLPPESFINSLGYAFLNNKKLENAKAMFNMNVKNYPNSSNVYDSMGDCYLALKDSIKALEFFTKALDVGENDDSKEKIDMLKEQLNLE